MTRLADRGSPSGELRLEEADRVLAHHLADLLPGEARPEHGLVWHVNRAVEWGFRLLKRVEPEFTDEEFLIIQDQVLQALILHDLWKVGKHLLRSDTQGGKKHWWKPPTGIAGAHGGLLAQALCRPLEQNDNRFQLILSVRRCLAKYQPHPVAYLMLRIATPFGEQHQDARTRHDAH